MFRGVFNAPVLALGATYSLFCLVLWRDGHRPSATLLPIPPESYYLWQAVFLVPLFVGLAWIYSTVAYHLSVGAAAVGSAAVGAAAGGSASGRLATQEALSRTYALPLLLGFVIPDFVTYLIWGFDALVSGMVVYAPLALLGIVYFSVIALRRLHGLGWGRAFLVVLAAGVAQALVGGLVLR